MKTSWIVLVIVLIGLFVSLKARAEYIDLDEALVLQKIQCNEYGQIKPCIEAVLGSRIFFIIFDSKGESSQWEIIKGKVRLLWYRDWY